MKRKQYEKIDKKIALIKENKASINQALDYNKNYELLKANHELMLKDPNYNQLHLSAFSGLINDPNGLVKFKDKFHIFYQWSPFVATHFLKHWGHYTTKDFITFESEDSIISPSIPEDIDGIYSGGAIISNNELNLFYTGNVKAKDGVKKNTSYIINAKGDFDGILTSNKKNVLFEVNHNKYTRDFRDPKVVYIEEEKAYFMLIGAQDLNKKPQIAVYKSQQADKNYSYQGNIKFDQANYFEPAFMFECPDFYSFDSYDVLSFSTQGKTYFGSLNEARDAAIFAIGKMDWKTLSFTIKNVEHIDLGFDFYAPQFFSNTSSNEALMIGWLGMPDTEVHASVDKYNWAHNLSFPRVVEIKEGKIIQKLHSSIDKLKKQVHIIDKSKIKLTKRQKLFHLKIKGDFTITFTNGSDDFTIDYQNQNLTIDRSNMSMLQAIHFGTKWKREIKNIHHLEILLDNSIMEIFINHGEKVFTSKYFINDDLEIAFSSNIKGYYYDLKPIEINWNLKKSVLLPGEALIDTYKSQDGNENKIGGAPLNVALGIKKVGQIPYFYGAIGNDDFGKNIKEVMEENQLADQYLQVVNEATTNAIVSLDEKGEREFSFIRGADAKVDLDIEKINFEALALTSATALLGDSLYEQYLKLSQKAIEEKKLIFFDPNYRQALYADQNDKWIKQVKMLIEKSNVIKVSKEELALITNKVKEEEMIAEVLKWGNKITLVTLGKEGVLLIHPENSFKISSIKVNQIDSTGAGDAFFGYFIGLFLKENIDIKNINWDKIKEILKIANVAAALTVTKKGALESIPDFKEVKEML